LDTLISDKRGEPVVKQFENAATTIGGVELLRRILKRQFALGRMRMSGTATPEIWDACSRLSPNSVAIASTILTGLASRITLKLCNSTEQIGCRC
jgi:hypothetical protein